MPRIIFIIQVYIDWAHITTSSRSCYMDYKSIYAKITNTMITFVLPIILNILVIYVSIHHVHVTSQSRRPQHHVSAREKYHRSLVIQFLIFYIVWLLLWSPNVIIYQFTYSTAIIKIVRLLSFILVVLDSIIIGALDVRFWEVWQNIWRHIKNRYFLQLQPQQRQIRPIQTNFAIPLPQLQQIKPV